MAQRMVSKLRRRARKTTNDIYLPLDATSRAIRVLRLQPDSWEHGIRAELQATSIEDVRGRYVAISYTWGSEGVARQFLIKCNGKSVSISENLFTVLRKLRHPDHEVLIWADALCINQTDASERTKQVGMMGDIYSSSRETIIWLGEPMLGEDIGSRFLKGNASEIAWKGDSRDENLRNEFMLDFERSCTAAPLVLPANSSVTHTGPDIFGAFCLIQDFAEDESHPLLNLLDRNKATILERIGYPRRHGIISTDGLWHGSQSLRVWEGLTKLMDRAWVHIPGTFIGYGLTIEMAVATNLGHPRDCALKKRHSTLRHALSALVNVR
jgi:hypothetical protein